ncbi:MAG: hypothetical protein ABIF82_03620 [Planctomycetota bacterium]
MYASDSSGTEFGVPMLFEDDPSRPTAQLADLANRPFWPLAPVGRFGGCPTCLGGAPTAKEVVLPVGPRSLGWHRPFGAVDPAAEKNPLYRVGMVIAGVTALVTIGLFALTLTLKPPQ